jgi:hypothetical protein
VTIVAAVAAFAAGLVVGIRLVAALYGPIDLWYTIGTAWPVVVRRLVLWTLVTAAALAWLDGTARAAFVTGMLAHVLALVAFAIALPNTYPRRFRPTRTVE